MKTYLSLIKFSHTIFALPFACIGYFLAVSLEDYAFDPKLFVLVVLCMVFARSAAMAFNRYIDAHIDEQNPRTAVREIPSGKIAKTKVLWLVIANSILFIFTTWFINPLCFYLSAVALLVILGYSYTKRFTLLCHFILGVGLALAPIGAYIAVTASFDWLPLLFSVVVLSWVSGFDIIYALQDVEFDKSLRLKSVPVSLGKRGALWLSSGLHVLTGVLVIGAGIFAGFGWLYWLGALFFIALLIYQHTLVSADNLSRVNLAFFTANGIASVIFAVFMIVDLFVSKQAIIF